MFLGLLYEIIRDFGWGLGTACKQGSIFWGGGRGSTGPNTTVTELDLKNFIFTPLGFAQNLELGKYHAFILTD